MGMYNVINFEAQCRVCKAALNDWQTKDAEVAGKYPIALLLLRLDLPDLSSAEAFTFCDQCRTSYQFKVANGKLDQWLTQPALDGHTIVSEEKFAPVE